MKQILITVLVLVAYIGYADAQTLKQLVIEPAPEETSSVFSSTCNSPDLAVVVFKSAISGIWFDMYPPSKLINRGYNRQRNEYVMCVEPTDGKYRFTITHEVYESVDIIVDSLEKNKPQFFVINPKENPVSDDNNTGQLIATESNLQMPADNATAILYIYRKRKLLDILPKKYDILLDNTIVGNSTNNWKTTITVNNFGTQTLSATIDGRKANVRINFQSGNVYYVRSDVSSKSVSTGEIRTTTDKNGKTTRTRVTEVQYTPILQLVDKRVGESEFNAIIVK